MLGFEVPMRRHSVDDDVRTHLEHEDPKPMPLSDPTERDLAHTRTIVYTGYRRKDGFWDIEGHLVDRKSFDFQRHEDLVPAGNATHEMRIRLTVDDKMAVVAAEASMDATPMSDCQAGKPPLQQMVGMKMGRGWRQAVEQVMGSEKGCTHLREMLANMPTAAFQTMPSYTRMQRLKSGEPIPTPKEPSYALGRCIGWAFDGPAVARVHPQFVNWSRKTEMTNVLANIHGTRGPEDV